MKAPKTPCGVWTIKKVAAADVDDVVAEFQLDNPTDVAKKKNGDGTFDVTATFPPCGNGAPTNQS